MSASSLSEIEQSINQLSREEQLWLIERLAHTLRETTWEAQLVAMASEPEIQRELKKLQVMEELWSDICCNQDQIPVPQTIHILDRAEDDLVEGYRFYENQERGVGAYVLSQQEPVKLCQPRMQFESRPPERNGVG